MAMNQSKRTRIIYPSQSVCANGKMLHRVQTLGSTSTFTSEDIFELGKLDVVDIVDDSPQVAITIETHEWGDVYNLANLAGLSTVGWHVTANARNANLVFQSSEGITGNRTTTYPWRAAGTFDITGVMTITNMITNSDVANDAYYHGVDLVDFSTSSVPIWAAVQSEGDAGTTTANLDQTLFMDNVAVSSVEWSFTQGANASENYAAETDNKMWLLNNARFVSWERWTVTGVAAKIAFAGYNNNTAGKSQGAGTGVNSGLWHNVITMGLPSKPNHQVATLSDGSLGFLYRDPNGVPAVKYYNASKKQFGKFPVVEVTASGKVQDGSYVTGGRANIADSAHWVAGDTVTGIHKFGYLRAGRVTNCDNVLFFPLDFTTNVDLLGENFAGGDYLEAIYCSDVYTTASGQYPGPYARNKAAVTAGAYKQPVETMGDYYVDLPATGSYYDKNKAIQAKNAARIFEYHPSNVGSIRSGQVEIYVLDPETTTTYDMALRVTSATITVDITREPLHEIGHLRAYARPVKFPIPISIKLETTASDLEQFAIFAGKESTFDAATLTSIDIQEIMNKKDNVLVVMIYEQTDMVAGGTHTTRKVNTTNMYGTLFFEQGVAFTYSGTAASPPPLPERERPLKTIIVRNLRPNDEAYNVSTGGNATQTFSFTANNDLVVVRGYVPIEHIIDTTNNVLYDPGITKNTNLSSPPIAWEQPAAGGTAYADGANYRHPVTV